MVALKKEFITLMVGAGLSAVGLTSVPLSEGFLTAGSALISLSYGIVLLGWRAGKISPQAGTGLTPSAPTAPQPQAPSMPPPPVTPTPPPESTVQTPSMAPPGAPTPSVSAPTTSPPPVSAPSAPPTTPAAPSPPSPPSYAAPTPPAAPSIEQPKPPGRKLPSAPKIQLPKSVIENKVPIALLAIGLVLVIVALDILFPGTNFPLGAGVLIPGALFLGVGGVLLFLRLYRKEAPVVVEVRRFCMHCGFQMSAGDVRCPRCQRQPPSGVDTKVCPNCGAVIPTLAKFCRDCGAGQPATG